MSDTTKFEELAALDADHVMQTYGRLPVAFVRGEGTVLWDSEGKRYLDFLAGLAVRASVTRIRRSPTRSPIRRTRSVHVSNLYYNDVQPHVAARLDALLGGGGRVFFANSGAEANECAIKLARRYGQLHGGPERFHVISAYGSFHGRTLTTLAATGQPQKQETFQPLPEGFRQVAYDDLDALTAAIDERVAAVMLEAVQGEGGVVPASTEYLQAVRRLCDEREALLILDEVQCGLGRTGKWFGFEHAGIKPDIVTMAKALGNGMPIGVLGAGRCRIGVRARRPRNDVRRPAARRAPRSRHSQRHGTRAGPRSGRARGDPTRGEPPEDRRRRRRARRRTPDRRRARARPRRQGRGAAVSRRGSGAERGHRERAPPRPAAARHRRRDRRSRRDHRGRVRGRERTSMSRSFLEVDDLGPGALAALLDRAIAWKADPGEVPPVLEGKGVAALFEKPSARTRISIEMAVEDARRPPDLRARKRSASTPASRSKTSRARWPACAR